MRSIRFSGCVLTVFLTGASVAEAQWLTQPTPGLPRNAEGNVEVDGPAPRLPDGRPDLSGLWRVELAPAFGVNITADVDPATISTVASQLSTARLLDLGKDDPSSIGCLPMGPRSMARGGLTKVIQTPTLIVLLYEDLSYRQIHLDGRSLQRDPSPAFMGYSVGRWDGDTLVVESNGYNDRTWLDFGGHPHTEQLKTVERFRRVSFGRIERHVTMTDTELYRAPITFPAVMNLAPDTELLEYVCGENPVSRPRLTGRTDEQQRVVVPPDVLASYVGTYEATGRPNFGVRVVTVSVSNGQLFADLNGKGHLLMVPLSQTMFTPRLLGTYEFVKDSNGTVTHLFAHEAEGSHRFNRKP